jgi:hypothetical protein
MTPASPLRRQLTEALAEARAQRDLLVAATAAQGRTITALEAALEGTFKRGGEELPADLPPPTEHRRRHKPGRQSKIEGDPELRAFIDARLDRCTFHEIAAAVAARFPSNRRVGKSAIGDYSKRLRTRRP